MWYRLSSNLFDFYDKTHIFELKYKYNELRIYLGACTIFCK